MFGWFKKQLPWELPSAQELRVITQREVDKKQKKIGNRLLNELASYEEKYWRDVSQQLKNYATGKALLVGFDFAVNADYFYEIKEEYRKDMCQRLRKRFEAKGYRTKARSYGDDGSFKVYWGEENKDDDHC